MGRRMFSPKIVCSDAFLDMPTSSQALYLQLSMNSDDDGFVNPKRIVRSMGASDDDLKVLIGKRFILSFQDGVVVIKHWRVNNLIRKDWYNETIYMEHKKGLRIKENGSYTDNVNEMLTSSLTQVRLGKVSIDKKRRDTVAVATDSFFEEFRKSYPRKENMKKAYEKWRKLSEETKKVILKDIILRKEGDQWKAGFIPHPTTYLNGERWNDDITKKITRTNSVTI